MKIDDVEAGSGRVQGGAEFAASFGPGEDLGFFVIFGFSILNFSISCVLFMLGFICGFVVSF